MVIQNKIRNIIRESIKKVLVEGFLDDIYLSDNFKRWFNGSKIVDENGKPLLLGHGTVNFGFKSFKTRYIHLAPINDASYFSGGNKRMFKFKKTLNKLSNEDVVNLYNKYLSYANNESEFVYKLDDNVMKKILNGYEEEIYSYKTGKFSDWFSKEDNEEYVKALNNSRKILINYYNKNMGHLCCVPHNSGLPMLTPGGFGSELFEKDHIDFWLNNSFPTFKQLKNKIITIMFDKSDFYKSGTYALCARVINPLVINCNWNTWDRIFIRKDSCNAYDELFNAYCKHKTNNNSNFVLDNESIAYLAKELGYDGVIFHNIREGGDGEYRMNTTYIVYSTKQLKSPFENNGEFGDIENLFK